MIKARFGKVRHKQEPLHPSYLSLLFLQPLSPLLHCYCSAVLQSQQSVSVVQFGSETIHALLRHPDAAAVPLQLPHL